jgi:hypothetical protein
MNCPNCDALLSYATTTTILKCEYCGFETHLSQPASTTRRTDDASVPTPRAVPRSNGPGCLPLIVIALILIGGFIAVGIATGLFEPGLPATLDHNETIEISDRTATIAGTAITASGYNCKIIIRNSTIHADKLVVAEGNAEITIIHSTIETTGNTLELTVNPKIRILDNSKVISKNGVVIKDGTNVQLEMKNSVIQGAKGAIDMDNNGEFRISEKSEIRGQKFAVQMKNNGKFRISEESRVVSQHAGIIGEHNLEIEMSEHSTVASESGIAIEAKLNGHFNIEESDVIGRIAIATSMNLELTLEGGKIEGTDKGIETESNARINVEAGVISGQTAVETDQNSATIQMEGGDILGENYGILANEGLHLKMTGGKISGNTATISRGQRGINQIVMSDGQILGGEFGIVIEKSHSEHRFSGGEVKGDTALKVADHTTIELDGGNFIGSRVGIEAGEVLQLTGSSGRIEGGEFAIVRGAHGTGPATSVTVNGAIKEKPSTRPGIRAGFYVNGKRIM